jgi:hypothetical protein
MAGLALSRSQTVVAGVIRATGGTVVATISPGRVRFMAGSAEIAAHWIEQLAELGAIEPADPGLLADASPHSWRLSRAAVEALANA